MNTELRRYPRLVIVMTREGDLCWAQSSDQEEFQCPSSGECVPLSSLCDGSYDCRDTSDEDRDHCSTTDTLTQVRLTPVNTGAAAGHTGLLEVLHNGVWGSVCSSVRPRLISSAP